MSVVTKTKVNFCLLVDKNNEYTGTSNKVDSPWITEQQDKFKSFKYWSVIFTNPENFRTGDFLFWSVLTDNRPTAISIIHINKENKETVGLDFYAAKMTLNRN